MPVFRYAGYRADGSKIEGKIEASQPAEASFKLKEQGVYLKFLKPEKTGSLSKKQNLSHITRQLSTLLGAGVPLVDALKSIAQESSSVSNIINDIREKVSRGASLWKALEEQGRLFPEFYINMVKAAEMSGELSSVLERIAIYLESHDAIKSRIRTAMIYPSIMVLVAGGVLFFIFLYVMPKIVKIFEDTKASLPFITKILIAITKFLKPLWLLIPLGIIGLICGIRYLKNKRPELIDRLLLKEPFGILMPLYISRFTKTLAFLLEGGVSMIKALEVSAKTTGNTIIEKNILLASSKVAEGGRLSASIQGFPPVLLELIATGEKSGTLVENLKKASSSYEEEFSRSSPL